jgi:hypothetical protein
MCPVSEPVENGVEGRYIDREEEEINQLFIESRKLIAPSVSLGCELMHLVTVTVKSPAFLKYKYVKHVPDIRWENPEWIVLTESNSL